MAKEYLKAVSDWKMALSLDGSFWKGGAASRALPGRIRSGKAYIKLGKFDAAAECFAQVSADAPSPEARQACPTYVCGVLNVVAHPNNHGPIRCAACYSADLYDTYVHPGIALQFSLTGLCGADLQLRRISLVTISLLAASFAEYSDTVPHSMELRLLRCKALYRVKQFTELLALVEDTKRDFIMAATDYKDLVLLQTQATAQQLLQEWGTQADLLLFQKNQDTPLDLYALLGITPELRCAATATVIQDQYTELAIKYYPDPSSCPAHPDHQRAISASEQEALRSQFVKITQAFLLLSDTGHANIANSGSFLAFDCVPLAFHFYVMLGLCQLYNANCPIHLILASTGSPSPSPVKALLGPGRADAKFHQRVCHQMAVVLVWSGLAASLVLSSPCWGPVAAHYSTQDTANKRLYSVCGTKSFVPCRSLVPCIEQTSTATDNAPVGATSGSPFVPQDYASVSSVPPHDAVVKQGPHTAGLWKPTPSIQSHTGATAVPYPSGRQSQDISASLSRSSTPASVVHGGIPIQQTRENQPHYAGDVDEDTSSGTCDDASSDSWSQGAEPSSGAAAVDHQTLQMQLKELQEATGQAKQELEAQLQKNSILQESAASAAAAKVEVEANLEAHLEALSESPAVAPNSPHQKTAQKGDPGGPPGQPRHEPDAP
eukprot:gene4628-842_t